MLQLLAGKDLGDRIVILYGMDNGVFYEEDKDGDRSLPKPDDKGKYHVVGKVEVAAQKQAKGLFCNCLTILDRVKGCRKLLMAPGVRYFREACCVKEGHCSNLGESGYRRGMLEDLCRVQGGDGRGVQGGRLEELQGAEPCGAARHQARDG
jgi:hypothetical protein